MIPQEGGYFPLYAACINGHLEVVRVLLTHGASVTRATVSVLHH